MIANSINESSFRVCSNVTSLLDDDDFEGAEFLNVTIFNSSIANLSPSSMESAEFIFLDGEGIIINFVGWDSN